jgi:methyl-accepting chemotaxis protein
MAARKKTVRRRASETDGDRAFTVVLEQIRADNRVFGEALGIVREDLQGVREQMARGFEQMARGFEQVDRRFDRVEEDLSRVKDAIRHMRAAVDRKVDRDEVEGLVERAVARAVGH